MTVLRKEAKVPREAELTRLVLHSRNNVLMHQKRVGVGRQAEAETDTNRERHTRD